MSVIRGAYIRGGLYSWGLFSGFYGILFVQEFIMSRVRYIERITRVKLY